jgi:hypothetical protein
VYLFVDEKSAAQINQTEGQQSEDRDKNCEFDQRHAALIRLAARTRVTCSPCVWVL